MPARTVTRFLQALLATLVALFVLSGLAVAVQAQEEAPDPAAGDDPEESVVEASEEPAPEPVVREIVDDGDRAIQIVAIDESDYPLVDVILAVPPVLAGDLSASS